MVKSIPVYHKPEWNVKSRREVSPLQVPQKLKKEPLDQLQAVFSVSGTLISSSFTLPNGILGRTSIVSLA